MPHKLNPAEWGVIRTVHLLGTATSQDRLAKAMFIRFHALGGAPETIAVEDPVQIAQLVIAARQAGGSLWPGEFARRMALVRMAQYAARPPLRLILPGEDGA